ncbi:hypothetical protein ACLQ3K_06530 [Tsukamurella sp. DT100]|uniref:hypothetical protein n=1 Tax=Tsukamurella sp. DT100 TaxID=3393415 RepID=UPI003CF5DFD3
MIDSRNASRWEAPAFVAGSLAVFALALGQLLIAGLSLAICVSLWDQSRRPRRAGLWQLLFIGTPVVIFGFGVWELAHGRVTLALLLAAIAVGTVALAVLGNWRTRTEAGLDATAGARSSETLIIDR